MGSLILVLAYFLVGFTIDMWAYGEERDTVDDDWYGAGYNFTIIVFWPIVLFVALCMYIRDYFKGE